MTVRIYLKDEAPVKITSVYPVVTCWGLGSVPVSNDSGKFYLQINTSLPKPIPDSFVEYVENVSVHGFIPIFSGYDTEAHGFDGMINVDIQSWGEGLRVLLVGYKLEETLEFFNALQQRGEVGRISYDKLVKELAYKTKKITQCQAMIENISQETVKDLEVLHKMVSKQEWFLFKKTKREITGLIRHISLRISGELL